jgi:undecaprenyl-phosphate galactose phosphotransferase
MNSNSREAENKRGGAVLLPVGDLWPVVSMRQLRDFLAAFLLLVGLAPVLIVIGILLVREGRPILFKQQRVGQNGKLFYVFKFRSMVPNADEVLSKILDEDAERRKEWIRDQKLKCDPRITRTGHFLRKTSLDELPQLLNVLRGEMSLVGPRPILQEELHKYGRSARFYLAQKPGMTGLWQVSGRNDVSYRRRIAMDRLYSVRNSFSFDMAILMRTVLIVLRPRGAY